MSFRPFQADGTWKADPANDIVTVSGKRAGDKEVRVVVELMLQAGVADVEAADDAKAIDRHPHRTHDTSARGIPTSAC